MNCGVIVLLVLRSFFNCLRIKCPLCVQECDFFFGQRCLGQVGPQQQATLCIIKPHALTSNHAGAVLTDISNSFSIVGMQQFSVAKNEAAEFYEVYRGVVPPSEFTGMVEELTSGPCLVLQVASQCASTLPGLVYHRCVCTLWPVVVVLLCCDPHYVGSHATAELL